MFPGLILDNLPTDQWAGKLFVNSFPFLTLVCRSIYANCVDFFYSRSLDFGNIGVQPKGDIVIWKCEIEKQTKLISRLVSTKNPLCLTSCCFTNVSISVDI